MDSYGNEVREPTGPKPSKRRRRRRKRKPKPPPVVRTSVQYKRYIQSKTWATKRKRILAQRGSACYACGSQHSPRLHHRTYVRLGVEWPEDLIVLCEPCHNEVHRLARKGVVTLFTAHHFLRQHYRPNA